MTDVASEVRSIIQAATAAAQPEPETLTAISYRLRRNASTTHQHNGRYCPACKIIDAAESLAAIDGADRIVIR